MTGDVDHVVGTAEDFVVAGVVLDAPVEAGIHLRFLEEREVGGDEALVVAPDGGQATGRQRRHDADDALFVGTALTAVVAEQAHVEAIRRKARRAELHGVVFNAGHQRQHGPAGFGLPVVVDDRDTQLVHHPLVGGFVHRLAGAVEGAQL